MRVERNTGLKGADGLGKTSKTVCAGAGLKIKLFCLEDIVAEA